MQTNEEIFLKKLSDGQLIFDTKEAIKAEREATSIVVKYFREIYSRQLYLKLACTSLFHFATQELGYCEGSAQSRINAMKLVIDLPEVEKKIESGELSLTAASNLQSFFQMAKSSKKTYSPAEKLEVAAACYSKSTREVKIELASRNPSVDWVETIKPVSKDRFELKFTITDVLEEKVRKLKGVLAHSQPNINLEQLLETLVELGLEKFDPVRKAARAEQRREVKHKSSVAQDPHAECCADSLSAHETAGSLRAHKTGKPETAGSLHARETQKAEIAGSLHAHETVFHGGEGAARRRYIPATLRNLVWQRNQNSGCEFVSDEGQRCGSNHALQVDHVFGFARGGDHSPENLRILCANHNRFVWKRNARVAI